jgi:hypothetical protein
MSSAIAPLSQRPARAAPFVRHEAIAPLHLRKLLANDPRGAKVSRSRPSASILLDRLRGCGWNRALGDKCDE